MWKTSNVCVLSDPGIVDERYAAHGSRKAAPHTDSSSPRENGYFTSFRRSWGAVSSLNAKAKAHETFPGHRVTGVFVLSPLHRLLLQVQRLVRGGVLWGEHQPVRLQPLPLRWYVHSGQRRLRLSVSRAVHRPEVGLSFLTNCEVEYLEHGIPQRRGPCVLHLLMLSVWCLYLCHELMRVFRMFSFLFLPDLDVSLVPTAKMSPVKMVEHVLTVWTVLSVSVTRALGEKGKWFLSSFITGCPFPQGTDHY